MTEQITTAAHLMHLLRRLRQIGPERQPPFETVGITSAQLALLEWLIAQPGSNLQGIANGLRVTPPTVSVGVRRLEEVGLLERHPDPTDGRAWQFDLTETGTALCERVQRYRQEKTQRLLAGLTPEEQTTLLMLLERALETAEESS
ncbi:MAG: MarR family winged helix-turn-helix transcriptional regulator [Anaerolineae bacterium]